MGSATKQAERHRVFPIGDAVRIRALTDHPSHALLAAAMEACTENLAILEQGRIVYANLAFARFFGYAQSSELHGLNLGRVIPANQVLACIPPNEGPEAGQGTAAFDPAFIAIRKDGSPLRVQMACACFQVEARELLILRLRECPPPEANPRAPQLESLGRLVGAVAHDFNNLLTGILLYCDLLAEGLESHNPLRAYVAEIRRAGGHSAELVQQLMAVARPPGDKPAAHSWGEVISGIRNLLARLLGENIDLQVDDLHLGDLPMDELQTKNLRPHDLSPDHAGTAPTHDAAAERIAMPAAPMRQIILNLLLNARDAMPGGGHITLSVRRCHEHASTRDARQPSCIVLVVADTGCGMDASTRSRVFQTFFTTKKAGQGSGLGLSTVEGIVKGHGGSIQVDTQPGKGTRVSVHLPPAAAPAAHHSTKVRNRKRGYRQ